MCDAGVGGGDLAQGDGCARNDGARGIEYLPADLGSLIHGAAVVLELNLQGAPASRLAKEMSGTSFDIGEKIVCVIEFAIRTRTAHEVDVSAAFAPGCRLDMQRRVPG